MEEASVCDPVPFFTRAIALLMDPVKVPAPLLLPMVSVLFPALLITEPAPLSASMEALLEFKLRVPATVTSLLMDPRAEALPTVKVPCPTVTPPEKVFTPVRIRLPVLVLMSAPAPLMIPVLVQAKVPESKLPLPVRVMVLVMFRLVSAWRVVLLLAKVTAPVPMAVLVCRAMVPAFKTVPPE